MFSATGVLFVAGFQVCPPGETKGMRSTQKLIDSTLTNFDFFFFLRFSVSLSSL